MASKRKPSPPGHAQARSSPHRERPDPIETNVIRCGDNLKCLRALPDRCIDLIYIDPPFNSNRSHEATCARTGNRQSFDDRHASTADYIEFMRPRCAELGRLLKPAGSFYYHCDWHASHYVKVMLDQIFGESAFINEIVWVYDSGGRATRHFHRKHDILLLYSPAARLKTYTFNANTIAIPRNQCGTCGTKLEKWNNLKKHVGADGRIYRTIRSAGKTYRYYDDEPVTPSDVWPIGHLQQKDPERLGYPTQKPLALLERIVSVSSNPNDVVLDAFCGSGTTLAAAQRLGRRWIGIDISPAACQLAANRMEVALKEP
jgi:site-specific DNA-methyltransferase (adenine-specific)/adenine-specific DNA-methyltransferase